MTLLDTSHPAIIPGDSSKYVWTTYHPYKDLPRVLNPKSGWLQNSNEPPWTTTLPLALNPADYPAYMLPPPYIWPRPQTSMRMLYEDPSITFDELVQYKQSTFVELTRWVLDDLIEAASKSTSEIVQKSVEVLRTWDRHADADSVGAVLFIAWAKAYIETTGFKAFAVQWDINDPLNTPHGLADPDAAVAALEQVAKQLDALKALGGGIDVKYGDVFRLRYGEVDLPANGGPDLLGTFRVLTFVQDKDLRFRPVHGDSYIAVVEFSNPVHAKVLLSYGNSSQPNSPHLGDQLELFSKKELRDAWLTRDEIETHLEDKIVFDR
jgi:acyl-homoserine-lactone acylase